MALELYSGEVATGSLTDGETLVVEVNTQAANYIEALIDDNNGGSPSGYDLTVEFYSTSADAYFTVSESTSLNTSDPGIDNEIRAQKVRVTLDANATADYRLSVETFKEI